MPTPNWGSGPAGAAFLVYGRLSRDSAGVALTTELYGVINLIIILIYTINVSFLYIFDRTLRLVDSSENECSHRLILKYYTASLTEPQLGKNEPADVDSATSRNSLRQLI